MTAAAMSFVLAVCGLFQSLAAVPVSAGTTDAIDGQELTNSKEVSSLISDTWEEDYFGSITVDTEAGKVETDGETEKLDEVIQTPDASDGSEENVTIQQHAAGEKDTAESDPLLEEYIDTLPEDTLYTVEETENGEYEVTAPFQTKRLIVETMQLTDDYDATEVYYNTELNETILEFATEEDTKEAFDTICQKYGEESCYPDEIYYVDDILADDASLSSGTSYSWGTAYMGMNTLKAQAEGKYGAVTVAILDTGIDRSNFMFQSRTISPQSYNFIDANKNVSDNHGHGTHVAGIIAEQCPVPCVKDIEQQRIFLSADDQDGAAVCAEPQCFRRQYEPRFRGSQRHVHHLSGFPHQQGVPKRNRHQLRFRQQRGGCLLLLSGMQQQDAGSLLLRAE